MIFIRESYTDKYYVCVEQDMNKKNPYKYRYFAKEKIPNGIRQFIGWDKRLYKDQKVYQWLKTCPESPRPFKVGQGCDGTIDSCVHALLYFFLQSIGQSYINLYNITYENEQPITEEEISLTIKMAQWEGITVPRRWTDESIKRLLYSLQAINNSSLIDLLVEHVLKDDRYLHYIMKGYPKI